MSHEGLGLHYVENPYGPNEPQPLRPYKNPPPSGYLPLLGTAGWGDQVGGEGVIYSGADGGSTLDRLRVREALSKKPGASTMGVPRMKSSTKQQPKTPKKERAGSSFFSPGPTIPSTPMSTTMPTPESLRSATSNASPFEVTRFGRQIHEPDYFQ